MFPIRPGQQNFLSGTMGELRSNHFHAGIDIKTGGVTGYKVHAAAEGYISRVKISSYGYGQAIYIKHPNGLTTVYAHLENFSSELEKYIRKQQYKLKRFDVDLYLTANHFTVQKGDVIAYSGNTGGSGGPHLHFEIRNEREEALNPLLFGFKEIKDNTRPTIKKIFIKPADVQSRVNGYMAQQVFYPRNHGIKGYTLKDTIFIEGKALMSIDAIDQLDGASNNNGVTQYEVFLDNTSIFSYNNEEVSFVNKYYNQHIDYKTWCEGKGRAHKCYIDDGNYHSYYKSVDRGFIQLKDSSVHQVRVVVSDSYNNKSELSYWIKLKKIPLKLQAPSNFDYSIDNNMLICDLNTDSCYKVNFTNEFNNFSPSSIIADEKLTRILFDMRRGVPYSVSIDSSIYELPLQQMIPSGKSVTLNEDRCTITFPSGALFDTLYLELSTKGDTFAIGNRNIPLNRRVTIKLKLKHQYTNKTQWAVYNISNGNKGYEGGTWNNNSISFNTKYFGEFTVLKDSIAPKIRYLGLQKNSLRFQISDNLSGISSFNGYINGEWLLFEYDYKRNLIWSVSPYNTSLPKGHFQLIVKDEVGNINKYEIDL